MKSPSLGRNERMRRDMQWNMHGAVPERYFGDPRDRQYMAECMVKWFTAPVRRHVCELGFCGLLA